MSRRETCFSFSVASPTAIGLFLDFTVPATSAYEWSRSMGRVRQSHGGSFPHLGQGLMFFGDSIFVVVVVGGLVFLKSD